MSKSEAKTKPSAPKLTARTLITRAVLLGGLFGLLLSWLGGGVASQSVFDSWQRISPRTITADNVAVVLIDDDSIEATSSWPWPRKLVAQLIERIGEEQPSVIGVDIYFDQADPLRPEAFASLYQDDDLRPALRDPVLELRNWDNELARVIGAYPTVLARAGFEDRVTDAGDYSFNAEYEDVFENEVEGTPPDGTLNYDFILGSIYKFDGAALSRGMVNGAPDADGIVRRVPLTVVADEKALPGFAIELARVAMGIETLRWQETDLFAGSLAIAADDNAAMRFKMGKFPAEADYSAIDVLEGNLPPGALRDKVVIIGVGAAGTYDIVASPLEGEVYGAFIQAQAVDAIIEGEWLSRPAWLLAVEVLAAILLFGLVFGAGVSNRNWLLAVAMATALALPVMSWIAYQYGNVLFDPARPFLIGLFAAIALWIMRYQITRAALANEKVRAAIHQKEMQFAHDIQMSMVPGEKTLSRLDNRADIAGVLKPAKSVGGDFFDAVKINEDQLLFLVGDVSGKGVAAALFMALSKTAAKSNLARAGDGLADAVASLNRDLMDEADPEMGLTMLIGLLDCATGAVQLVNAGHENPLIIRGNGTVENFEMVGGPPFCVLDFPYPVETAEISNGDTIVIITDGATEAANEANDLFGIEGVLKALEAEGEVTAAGRVTYLAKNVRDFEGSTDPSDDLTIFAVRYLGNG